MSSKDFYSWASERTEEKAPVTGFVDNFQASVGEFFDESSTISNLINQVDYTDRRLKIEEAKKDGKFPDEVLRNVRWKRGRATDLDEEALVMYYNKFVDPKNPLPDKEELTKQRNDELKRRAQYRYEVARGADTSGKIGSIVGGFVAPMGDPVYAAATILTGGAVGTAQGLSRGLYALKFATREAAVNAGATAAASPWIASWREEIGSEYTLEEALTNIALDATIGGTVGGLTGFLSHKYKLGDITSENRDATIKRLQKQYKLSNHEAGSVVRAAEEAKAASIVDPNTTIDDFYKRAQQTEDNMNDFEFVEPDNITDEKVYESWLDKQIDDLPDDFEIHVDEGTTKPLKEYLDEAIDEVDYWLSKVDCIKKFKGMYG